MRERVGDWVSWCDRNTNLKKALLVVIALTLLTLVAVWIRPRTIGDDLRVISAMAPALPDGAVYWNETQETRRGCCDSPNARIRRAYLIDCAESEKSMDTISEEIQQAGFPPPTRSEFPGSQTQVWQSGPIAADVSAGEVSIRYEAYVGARLPENGFENIDSRLVRNGCTLEYTIAVGDL